MMVKRVTAGILSSLFLPFCFLALQAQETPDTVSPGKKVKKNRGPKPPPLEVIEPFATLDAAGSHEDFPVVSLNPNGDPIVVYIENDGTADRLQVAGLSAEGEPGVAATLSSPASGNLYQPCLTRLGDGTFLAVWSELEEDGQWDLRARAIQENGTPVEGDAILLTRERGNDIFADLGTDARGRAWVVWQRFQNGTNRIFARVRSGEDGSWSGEIPVSGETGGNWEPRLAFGPDGGALVVYDSYRRGDFDLFLTRISPDGTVGKTIPLAETGRYEARGEAMASPDGESLWVVFETGMERWGKDLGAEWRKKGGGLHHDREIKLIRVDLKTDEIEGVADVTALLPDLVANPGDVGTGAIDVPEVIVDAAGFPWVFFRYCLFKSPGFWQIACARMDPSTGDWTRPEVLGNSSYCLDRRTSVALAGDGTLATAYASDSRTSKQAGDTGVFLARISPGKRASVGPMPFDLVKRGKSRLAPYNQTPERERGDHHTWNFQGEDYYLFWGDVHRHTDFSNCRTTDDGCIVEHYRYAIEAGGLDYLGTSDHTEVGKRYSDYEWWQTQKIADLFHNPGSFVSIYAYEREQKYPYGHRNVLFLERGGPVVYIKRNNYAESRWATPLPPPDGERFGEIPPWQLWDLLRTHGKRAITIEHTSGGRMGTDWSKYERIDTDFENILEVFQGSRESYEGQGAPQPPVVVGSVRSSEFEGDAAKGTWQEALRRNHRLGAFASSDHRSVNLSYGGVYVKELTRKEIFDAMDARRTVAATDKIYLEFSCNGKMMGKIFESREKPGFEIRVNGTAPIARITLVRNEEDYRVFQPDPGTRDVELSWKDETPLEEENRYYLRVEQVDGNMAWTSPVWVTIK